MTRGIALMSGLLSALVSVSAQSQMPEQAALLRFEVASVKPSPPLNPAGFTMNFGRSAPGGKWRAENATLLRILQRAYPEYNRPGMIVGGPAWVTDRFFDIDARATGNPTPSEYAAMVRNLLAERFSLKTHIEPRPIEVYRLVVARADGRLGPRLRAASPECLAEMKGQSVRLSGGNGSEFQRPCKGTNGPMQATGLVRFDGARTLESLARTLQAMMDRLVVDRTGLQGFHEMDLEFDLGATRSATGNAGGSVAGVTVFTAIQEQLGLKLERSRELVDVLVIDSVQMPSEN